MRWLLLFTLLLSADAAEPGYADPATCRPCHAKIFESYKKTAMGRSFAKVDAVPPLTEFRHQPSERFYSVVDRAGTPYLRRVQAGGANVIEKRMDYAIGSGNHSKTYLTLGDDGRFLELPLSWYAEGGGAWSMSPGYDRPDHSDFRREVPGSCLFCHNGYPSQANHGIASGIDCQRCHGPGEAHASGKGGMVNPAKLSLDRQLEVCLQCHLESASRSLPDSIRRFDRTPFSYRPGQPLGDYMLYFDFIKPASDDRITVNNSAYGLMRSQCFLRSAGKLRCTTCHNPHETKTGAEAERQYTQACRGCHQTQHQSSTRDCAGCHMQKRRTEDAVHVVMTDHFIRRHPLDRDLTAPLTERHDRMSGPVRLLYPRSLPDTPDTQLYMAVAQANAPALEAAIAAAQPKHAEPYIALAEAYRKSGQPRKSIAAFERAVELGPNDARPYAGLADLLLGWGEVQRAIAILEPAPARMPEDSSLLNGLSVLYSRQQRFGDALGLLSKAVRVHPDDPLSWLNLGVCLEATGDRRGAEAAYRQAIVLQPDFARARQYLSRISKDKF
jgi:Putative Zn-dependent protease, contains TPR repeats